MRLGTLLLFAAAVLLAVTGTAAAADNTAPLANAGVDQTVPVNSTVYLDANGSTDPDGEIRRVEWTIETPDGATMTPDCGDCRRAAFDATAVGQYTVTLTVTDDDGATSSDTLYVTTTTERGPNVSIAGPTSTAPDSNATFTANVSADQASLQTLTWLVNGSVVERASLDGASATHSFTHSVDETVPVRAVVYDTLGDRGSATQRVSVGSGGMSSGCYLTSCNGTGADARYTNRDGVTIITDTNDKEGLQTYYNDRLRTIENPDENPKLERGLNGGYRITGDLTEDDFVSVRKRTQDFGSPVNIEGGSGDTFLSHFDTARDSINDILSDGDSSSDGDSESSSGGGDSYRSGIMFQ